MNVALDRNKIKEKGTYTFVFRSDDEKELDEEEGDEF